jgi:hypothetical protein
VHLASRPTPREVDGLICANTAPKAELAHESRSATGCQLDQGSNHFGTRCLDCMNERASGIAEPAGFPHSTSLLPLFPAFYSIFDSYVLYNLSENHRQVASILGSVSHLSALLSCMTRR